MNERKVMVAVSDLLDAISYLPAGRKPLADRFREAIDAEWHTDLEGQDLYDHMIVEHPDVELGECTYGEVFDAMKRAHVRLHAESEG